MTTSRNTIWALGLILLVLATGQTVLGASTVGCEGASCDASCGTPPNGNTGCNAGCDVGCDAGSKPVNRAACANAWSPDDEPLFRIGRQCFQDLCETCDGCTWKADASVLVMHRSTPGTRAVLLDPTSGADLFDASRLEFPFAAGPRVSLTALDCEGWGFEVNYFGIDGWSAASDVPARSLPNGGNLVVDSVTQLPVTDAHFESIARFYSAEVNFRKPLFGSISLLAGFRWLELTDRYLAEGTSATAYPVSETILTHNHLYGSQIGADGTLFQVADRWRITGFVKGGIFFNDSDQATFLSDLDPAGPGSHAVNTNSITRAAFFGETGIVGYVQISKHLSASGGYQVMFVNGVAQPVNQLSDTNLAKSTATVDASSGLFYHGATAGLEVTW